MAITSTVLERHVTHTHPHMAYSVMHFDDESLSM